MLSWFRLLSPLSRVFLVRVCGAPEMYESAFPESSLPHPGHPYAASPETRPFVRQGCRRFLCFSAPGCAGPGTVGALEVGGGLTHTHNKKSRMVVQSHLSTKLKDNQKQHQNFQPKWTAILSLSGNENTSNNL